MNTAWLPRWLHNEKASREKIGTRAKMEGVRRQFYCGRMVLLHAFVIFVLIPGTLYM